MANPTSNLENLVRLLKADGGMAWPADDKCSCSACRLKRQIDVELDRLAAETPARQCSRCDGAIVEPNPNFCPHCAAAFGGRFHVKTREEPNAHNPAETLVHGNTP